MRSHLIHVTDKYSAVHGGVPTMVEQIARWLAPTFERNDIVSVRGDPLPAPAGVTVTDIKPVWPGQFWGWSPALRRKLTALIGDPAALVHIHGVWMAPHLLAAKLALAHRRPFVLSAHGSLAGWFWNKQGPLNKIKKELYWSLFAGEKFRGARIVHAITSLERDEFNKLFPGARIEIIPNAVNLELIDDQIGTMPPDPEPVILFVGRLHPVKGLEVLLRGFAKANLPSKWKVALVGPAMSPAYEQALKKLVYGLEIESRVNFIGPVYGAEKWKWFRRAWITAVPSFNEVICMVNLESAACATPTMTTRETGLLDWEEGGGILTERTADGIVAHLRNVAAWPLSERLARGAASRSWVEKHYSWNVVLPRWIELYRSVSQ
jgi:glycosyltransferase involved in cell wall biosynthesis